MFTSRMRSILKDSLSQCRRDTGESSRVRDKGKEDP